MSQAKAGGGGGSPPFAAYRVKITEKGRALVEAAIKGDDDAFAAAVNRPVASSNAPSSPDGVS
jgi:hypothetical protein